MCYTMLLKNLKVQIRMKLDFPPCSFFLGTITFFPGNFSLLDFTLSGSPISSREVRVK